MKRREFITLLGGAAAAWPLAARAQQRERVRRIGVLSAPLATTRNRGSQCGIPRASRNSGGVSGRNLEIEYRWGGIDAKRHTYAAELFALAPDSSWPYGARSGTAAGSDPHRAGRVPQVTDPVGSGFVASLARPGGNTTGFTLFEFGISGEVDRAAQGDRAARTRALVLLDPATATGSGQLRRTNPRRFIRSRDQARSTSATAAEIEHASLQLCAARTAAWSYCRLHTEFIAADIACGPAQCRHVSVSRTTSANGGLISYGPNELDRSAARPTISIASLRAKSPPICRCRRRPSSSSSSTSRPPRRSASKCRDGASPRRRGDRMKRREFITLFGGAAAWPLAARAQQPAKLATSNVFCIACCPEIRMRFAAFGKARERAAMSKARTSQSSIRWAEGAI